MVGEAGIKLSGGQRQRLAIARSIVKRPMILILDEATSSIDVRGEQVVQAALDKVSKDRTTLVIAHRLATVRRADNIVVLRKGKVVQQGTHEHLMEQEGGAYWALATAQQLTMESEEDCDGLTQPCDAEIAEKKSMATIGTETTLVETTTTFEDDPVTPPKARGFWASFALLLREQRHHGKWYIILLFSALGGGGMFHPLCAMFICCVRPWKLIETISCLASQPIQAYLFATELTLFQFWGDWLSTLANFWSLMFVMLAIFVAISYFALGWSSSTIAFVSNLVFECQNG